MKHNVPVQSLIDHIKTAIDVDPWAKEMAEDLLKDHEEKPLRCEKCSYHKNGWCGMHGRLVNGTDYCSWGAWKGR